LLFGSQLLFYALDDSDEPVGLIKHLPRRVLRGSAHTRKGFLS